MFPVPLLMGGIRPSFPWHCQKLRYFFQRIPTKSQGIYMRYIRKIKVFLNENTDNTIIFGWFNWCPTLLLRLWDLCWTNSHGRGCFGSMAVVKLKPLQHSLNRRWSHWTRLVQQVFRGSFANIVLMLVCMCCGRILANSVFIRSIYMIEVYICMKGFVPVLFLPKSWFSDVQGKVGLNERKLILEVPPMFHWSILEGSSDLMIRAY